jgi:hypothetical protein
MIQDCFKIVAGMSEFVKKCKALTSYTHHSALGNTLLKNESEKDNKKYTKLITPVETRCNSICMCLDSVFCNKDDIQSLSTLHQDFQDRCPKIREFEMNEGAAAVLTQVQNLSELLSADLEPTSIYVLPKGYDLQEFLKTFRSKSSNKGKGKMLVVELEKSLKKRFPNCGADEIVYYVGNFWDARFKGLHLKQLGHCYDKTVRFLQDQVTEHEHNQGVSSEGSNDYSL